MASILSRPQCVKSSHVFLKRSPDMPEIQIITLAEIVNVNIYSMLQRGNHYDDYSGTRSFYSNYCNSYMGKVPVD